METTNPANSYDYQSNQNLYQSEVDASEQNIFENAGYYYTDQYGGIDQQIQPEQQVYIHSLFHLKISFSTKAHLVSVRTKS